MLMMLAPMAREPEWQLGAADARDASSDGLGARMAAGCC